MRPFSSFKRQTHVFERTTYAWQTLIVWGCCLNSFNFGQLVISMIFQLTFGQTSGKKSRNTLLCFERQNDATVKEGEYKGVKCPNKMPQKACKRLFCHVIAFAQFFEMPENRRMLFLVPFLFWNWSRVNLFKFPIFSSWFWKWGISKSSTNAITWQNDLSHAFWVISWYPLYSPSLTVAPFFVFEKKKWCISEFFTGILTKLS